MELVPCNETARQFLVNSLFEVNAAGIPKLKNVDYVARTFPSILLDIARIVAEQASKLAQELTDQPNVVIRHQLKPYFMFGLLLGKCPQITSLMYSYFESSSFQPLPENSFHWNAQEQRITYAYQGFSDELIIEILTYYHKYLAFNAKWFSATWNWSELGRFIALHTNRDIRFIAACCLSVITTPTREQHMSFVKDVIREEGYRQLVDLQIKHRQIFSNTFKPCIESKHQKAIDFTKSIGESDTGYSFCQKSIAKLANVLLLKRGINQKSEEQYDREIRNYVPVTSLSDSISKLAYAISVNKPCLIRGISGSGKTAILDYAAAKTNRIHPPDYVKVHIGDQIDSKLLIGNYVCTEIPGQFEWVPGPLTRAMTYGSWIVFEDIDMASSEIIQVIHSVIENGNLTCVSCCPIKLDSPHPEFRIFFTQRFENASQSEMTRLGLKFVDRFCDIVDIPELTSDELIEVIETKYKLGPLARIAIELYETSKEDLNSNCQGRTFRKITQRDLFKFCTRLAGLKLQCKDGKYNSKDLESVFLSAVDCLLASLPRPHIEAVAPNLGKIVNIPLNEVQRVLLMRKLELRERGESLVIGRVQLSYYPDATQAPTRSKTILAHTKQSLKLVENVGCCIQQREPVLLVGETGVGKTSIVQYLANMMKVDLVVVNLSQQSDSSDLLGGYKPVDLREVMRSVHENFEKLFTETPSKEEQLGLPQQVLPLYTTAKKRSQWLTYLKLVLKCSTRALAKDLEKSLYNSWRDLADKTRQLSKLMEMDEEAAPMALAFSDGSLLQAVKEGKWILLDEINLAEPDVLQCLILILDSINQPHIYMQSYPEEDGRIKIHPNFRLFACMNPSTDVGKRDLDSGTRGRFTEFFVDEIEEKPDLRLVVESYVKSCLPPSVIENLVKFYMEIRARSYTLSDISGKPPVYSLRSLCRALTICSHDVCQNEEKSVFESLKIAFFQQLNDASVIQVTKLIEQIFFNSKMPQNLLKAVTSAPKDGHQYIPVEGFWIQKSNEEPFVDAKYIITDSVKRNLQSLARIISLGQRKLPILIQGNTSVGKTSMIRYLAQITGNRWYRINNHEHTDLQEYVGRYVLKENGELHFQEGLLVRAMKKGYWLILDELNLAPSELLEALNRVLDDNRELFIPETRELVRAHSKFVLFATQNPPEEYAGRKFLSRAFRNRFIELHFDDIPGSELEYILHRRCEMAPSHAKKIVDVMREIQFERRESGCFNGKSGFMTLRDLFRWGERYLIFKSSFPNNQFYDWDQHLAREGLILLEGRVRTNKEAETVKSTIEKVFQVQLDRDEVYGRPTHDTKKVIEPLRHVQFTKEFRMLFTQLSSALKYKEPVLLCGQTGCGKTTACQLYASTRDQKLITYNCHLNTESSDFVGSMRPSREQDESGITVKQTFPWVDGPLIEAMRKGAMFLVDEISLADDAVLERMNSVLEPSRSITLTEKDGEEIFANESFRLVATMNPGDDYGKKELSPALRNRFTEIYCHNTTDMQQIMKIVEGYLPSSVLKPKISPKLLHVMSHFLKEYYQNHDIVSIRDVLNWCDFISKMTRQPRPFSIRKALLHGADLVYLDQFGTCGHTMSTPIDPSLFKTKLRSKLRRLVDSKFDKDVGVPPLRLTEDVVGFEERKEIWWFLKKGPLDITVDTMNQFVYDTPTVMLNKMKLIRAMQLDRPILLEGDPGTGKTSLVTALARSTGNKLVRINLSEQTDISDLLGSDLPDSENTDSDKPNFCWHDGPMLRAIKESSWILLDEMNLAPQSVLEGLNACFDHRGEIYIPELNKRIKVDKSASKFFACQNPYNQGAARKGLPRSFVNRFTSIYVESHSPEDLIEIVTKLHPNLPQDHIENMIEFNNSVNCEYKDFGFEFNLRDILYWCDLITKYIQDGHRVDKSIFQPERFAQFVYLDRMRSEVHRTSISDKFKRIFARPIYEPPYRDIRLGEYSFIMARSILPRQLRLPPQLPDLCILKCQMPHIESLAKAIEFNKMPILVGEIGVGKRSIVKILAGLTGNVLNFIGANQEMDTVELLGSYEQRSLQREVIDLIDEAKKCTLSMINSISDKKQASTWSQIFNSIWQTLYVTSIRDQTLDRNEMMDAYRVQLHHMRELIANIKTLSSHETDKKCTDLLNKIDKLMRKPAYLTEPMYSTGNFEWIDSILIKSIREGTWLMIENANLMNPATLDRLNSLVEPNGNLSLNEKGATSKGIETIKPHPNFRLILAMDPQNGELSRAMRNRGVEIFMQPQFFFEDFLMLLNQNGFEPEEGKACMCYCIMQTSYDTFETITGEDPINEGSLLAYFGLNYLSTLTNQVRRGSDIDETLAKLLITHFTQTGFGQICEEKNIREFVKQKMDEYRQKYEVNLVDDRYKWRHLRHDLISLTGGDSVVAMVERDNTIFYEDFPVDLIFKPDEVVDNLDIVSTCITVKIFLEFSSHGDFEHREGFIREIFQRYPSMMDIVNRHVQLLHQEYLPLISSLMPDIKISPASEMHVDTRTAPDTHHMIQCMDYEGSSKRLTLQNRWLLSLHRIMLSMIVELIEERTTPHIGETNGNTSLWTLSEKVRSHEMLKEQLVKPVAEIATDLYDLLNGILRVVINRCLDNDKLIKLLPRLFWINFLICKLRRNYNPQELIATCNQIPMLWALTYQKVIVPIIKDCEMGDLIYNNKRFSHRIQHICDFLDVPLNKASHIEKSFYHKVVNKYASTTKQCESISREVEKLFVRIMRRYTDRSEHFTFHRENTLGASGLAWSNSIYLDPLYGIQRNLVKIEFFEKNAEDISQSSKIDLIIDETRKILSMKKEEYRNHEDWLLPKDDKDPDIGPYAKKCLNINRRRLGLDQFAPVWQVLFIQTKLAKLYRLLDCRDPLFLPTLCRILKQVSGIIMSPRYYLTVLKFLQHNEIRNPTDVDIVDLAKRNRENADMYVAYLQDHLMENVVLDSQIVGWTKLRVYTSNVSALAPLIPEYSPIVSLVASYCLDISHLKLNALVKSSSQLDAMLVYMWNAYTTIKFNTDKDTQDMSLARNLMHLRSKLDCSEEFVRNLTCDGSERCQCVEEYIKRQLPRYDELMKLIQVNLPTDDIETVQKSIKLIYFGYLNFLEYAPIFTFDPSLRAREKLEVYKSELAHVKLDLHFKNTLYYWKTGENLQLLEVEPEDTANYPFATQILIERRSKLEKSIEKLRKEYINRPKSDDSSLYYELRKSVEVHIDRYTKSVHSLMDNLTAYALCPAEKRSGKSKNVITHFRTIIKSLENSISHFRSDYALYADLMSNHLVGMCFVLQGLRCLYARLEQKFQIFELGFDQTTISQHTSNIHRVFSFNNFGLGNLESVRRKLQFLPDLDKICPADQANYIQSSMLRTVLIQMNHHITITPSDIRRCIPIVKRISDLFHCAWKKHREKVEQQRKQKEDLYQYKTSRTTLGKEISYEQREFLDICARFPTYDHIYHSHSNKESLTSTDAENMKTEEKMANLIRSVDLSICIDICKAHYKFIKQASNSLLGQVNTNDRKELPKIDIEKWTELEAETLYAITRHCLPTLDRSFDSLSIECHLLQAERLRKMTQKSETPEYKAGTLKNSIEILDEDIFDMYHSPNAHEVLKLQDFTDRLDTRINCLRSNGYENNPTLLSTIELITNISSFLITDPLMKFVTGAHAILEKIEEWNRGSSHREGRMIKEMEELIELIDHWRTIELKSWMNSLHQVKRKYIDGTLCDLWFHLHEAFGDPYSWAMKTIKFRWDECDNFELKPDHELIYEAFAVFVKDFLEEATLGDYQIRLDLVFSFAIQTRFAGIYDKTKKEEPGSFKIDNEKLTTYVYNIYIQYKGLLNPIDEYVAEREREHHQNLSKETRLVSWRNRNLWEIKQTFRTSHRKLNKIMNNYSSMLHESLPKIRPQSNQVDTKDDCELDSDRISATLAATQRLVSSVESPNYDINDSMTPLKKALKNLNEMKKFNNTIHDQMSRKYLENLMDFEESITHNADHIMNFKSHDPSELIIDRKDPKEVQEDKYKRCRQMQNSKKFALQSIFKELETLGARYRRGLNGFDKLDRSILSSEPLRGMIQDQSRITLKAADKLVDQQIIHSCNKGYKDLIASTLYLLCNSQEPAAELDSHQVERIRGFAMDMTQDIIEHKRNVAFIYKHLIDIQAATSRLAALEDLYKGGKVVIYNFSKVHTIVRQFDELVGRVYLAIAKIERIAMCCGTALNISTSGGGSDEVLLDIIMKEKESNSELMTQSQIEHLHGTISETRQSIANISDNLRDMLKYNSRNHLYSDDDLDRLEDLYRQFTLSIRKFLPSLDSEAPNTVLGSLRMLEGEAVEKLKPLLDNIRQNQPPVEIHQQANLNRLNLRLQKLMGQVKLAARGVYKRELESGVQKTMSESEKRNLKPFNYLDSSKIRKLLRLQWVAKHTGNCLATLNNYETCTNITAIVTHIKPILFIYSQDVSRYLNIVLGSLNIRLKAATQLTSFFTDVLLDGFGLPYKTNEHEEGTDQKSGQLSEDNAGFGEGQGETDVSKKLEFESQLDDLKKDPQEAEKDKEDDQDVEAHNDGVEMSDDIDAKAQGPDDQNGTDKKEDGDDEDDEDQEDLDNLDKDMGRVDQDEEIFDENLLSDEDDLPGEEDDEEDIRETDVDPDKDISELVAKDSKLSESKPKTGKKDNETESAEKPEEVLPTEDVTMSEQPETTDNDKELDLAQEAEAALRPEPTEEPQVSDDTNTDVQDEVSMSVSDGEDPVEDAKSEGEISKGDGSDDDEAVLDDDSIDKRLEDVVDPSKKDDLDQENFLEDVIHNMPHLGGGAGQDKDGQQKIKGQKIGDHTLYNTPNEYEDDLFGFDEPDEQSDDENMVTCDEAATKEKVVDAGKGSDGQAEDKAKMDIDSEEKDAPGAAEEKSETELEKSRPTKRTLADDQDHGTEVKRKRILEAGDDSKEQQGEAKDKETPDNTNKDSSKKQAETFRHIEQDKQNAIELIDIASSSDEECVDTNPQQSDQNNDTRIRPKEAIEKSNANSADQTAKDDAEKSEPIVIEVDSQSDKDDNAQDSNDKVKNDDILKETSSISSINSGQLEQAESDYEDCLEDAGSSNRQLNTIYNTNIGLLKYISLKGDSDDGTNQSATNLMELIDRELGKKVSGDYDSVDTDRLTGLWLDCTRSTSHLVHQLCQQLQIVLEPTKMSKYKGDYKSGKRLNMRKIISYIASHYRKDKIWLRRTKPNKRTYNIMLAVDNSSSMSENNCRQMTYQSLALLASSLSRIEAGSLSVVSFGEKFKCIHEFGQPYMDAIGAQWLRELRFNESKTSYGQLLRNACASFTKQSLVSQSQQSGYQRHTVSQLLIIISDGRNISSEEEEVKNHLRQLKSMGVLTLFVVIDDLKRNSGSSIIDIKRCIGIGGPIQLVKYMELFPFPFYVLLRQMETMPSVLGDALRQWFELVSSI